MFLIKLIRNIEVMNKLLVIKMAGSF